MMESVITNRGSVKFARRSYAPCDILRGMHPPPRVLHLVLRCVVSIVCSSVAAQEFVPRVPARSAPLPLAVGQAPAREVRTTGVRVIRQGNAGTQLIPAALTLPAPGTHFQAETFDWYRNGAGVTTIRDMHTIEPVYALQPGAELVVVSFHAAELIAGAVVWSPTAADRDVLGLGELVISGSGRVRVDRTLRRVVVRVETGRFDVRRSDQLLAVRAAGQEFALTLTESEAARIVAEAPVAVAAFATHHAALLDELLTTRALSGATLTDTWDRVRDMAPLLARAAALDVAWPRAPDLSERAIGEALRLLAAFAFVPALGM